MAMPNPFQKLKHGVLLCKRNFNTFVETFNFLVDFAQNIKGDGDANGNGTIVFDRTVPDRPVIRSKINFDYPFSKGVGSENFGRFCIVEKQNMASVNATIAFGNGYYRVGGRTYQVSDLSKSVHAAYIVALKVSLSGPQPTATLETFSNIANLNSAESDTDCYIMPLYQFDGEFNVVCDFRIGPDSAAWEFAS